MGHFGLKKSKLDNMIKIGFYRGIDMKILVTTWRHWLPIKILWRGTEVGMIHRVGEQNYYVTKVKKLFAYCVKSK